MRIPEILRHFNAAKEAARAAWIKSSQEAKPAREKENFSQIAESYNYLVMRGEQYLYDTVSQINQQKRESGLSRLESIDPLAEEISRIFTHKAIERMDDMTNLAGRILLGAIPDQETRDYIVLGTTAEAVSFWYKRRRMDEIPVDVRIVAAFRTKQLDDRFMDIIDWYAETKGRGPSPKYPGE